MKRLKNILFLTLSITVLITGSLAADGEDITQETGDIKQDVNIEINLDDSEYNQLTDIGRQQVIAIGITTPIVGGTEYKELDGERYATSMTGINWLLGYTRRNYFGNGLPATGATGYFEYGTMGIIVPYIGAGITVRIVDTLFMDIGFPNVALGFTF